MILNSNRKYRSLKSKNSKEKLQKEVEKSKCSGSTVVWLTNHMSKERIIQNKNINMLP